MKTTNKILALIGAAGVLAAPNLFAQMTINLSDDTTQYANGNGGEFRGYGNDALNSQVNWAAYSSSTAGYDGNNRYFQTFCTELSEEFNPGTTYTVTSIGDSALYAGTGHPVPITMGVAYLYSQFAAGTLSGYNYTYGSGRSATAGDLQNAIWTLLGEQGTALAGWVNTDLTTGLGGSITDWTMAANGAFEVADLTLGNPGQNQDQLVIVPEASTVIAGALLLLPLGVSAFRIVRKNRIA